MIKGLTLFTVLELKVGLNTPWSKQNTIAKFFFFFFFILIGGLLLYNIVLVLPSIDMNPPRVHFFKPVFKTSFNTFYVCRV